MPKIRGGDQPPKRMMKATLSLVVMIACAVAAKPAKAQQAKETLPAPMPSQIASAKKLLLPMLAEIPMNYTAEGQTDFTTKFMPR